MQRHSILVMVVGLLLAAAAIAWYSPRLHWSWWNNSISSDATSTAPAATSTVSSSVAANVSIVGAGTAIMRISSSSIEHPNLAHVVVYGSDLPPEVVSELASDISSTTKSLTRDPSQGDVWLRLAIYYKIAKDYHAAENVWVYLTKVVPQNYIAFADLGDLYQNFLQDYPKAEENYLKAVSINAYDPDLYYDLYMLYKYQYKTNTSAAGDILTKGLRNNPTSQTLLSLNSQGN